jgi:hypothetical protein
MNRLAMLAVVLTALTAPALVARGNAEARAILSIRTPIAPLTAPTSTPAQPFLAISVRHAGWYRISGAAISAAGLRVADPRTLHMTAEGKQIPIAVSGSASTFSRTGDVQFYGTGLDTPSTDTRIYWLTANGSPGLRIARDPAPPGSATSAPAAFDDTFLSEQRTSYDSFVAPQEAENWFGDLLLQSYRPSDSIAVAPPHPDPSGSPAGLKVALQGASAASHSVGVAFDGSPLGAVTFSGYDLGTADFSVPESALQSGGDTVTLTPSSGPSDVSLVDFLKLSYSHLYAARNDQLTFSAIAGQTVRVTGFSTSSLRVMDVTQPDAVRELTPAVAADGASYDVTVRAPAGSGRHTLFAFDAANAATPAMTLRRPSQWQGWWNAADEVVITYGPFASALKPLVKLRQQQGYRVDIIDVQDIYDDFGYGEHGPQLIKDFLAWTQTHWLRAPQYVLLVGAASYDPRDYENLGQTDLVPTKLVNTTYMQTASDSWFVDFKNNGIPQLAIGRLPARTLQELSTMVSKIVGYSPANELPSAVLVAGATHADDDMNFVSTSDAMKSLFPASMSVKNVDSGSASDATLYNEILSGIDGGPLFVNFIGHGNVTLWGSLLQDSDVPSLNNANHLPVFVMMNCLNGYFIAPPLHSLAEDLLDLPTGGAVGVWSSTGQAAPDDQVVMNRALYSTLFAHPGTTIGRAILQATSQVKDSTVLQTWVFLGDPLMKVN